MKADIVFPPINYSARLIGDLRASEQADGSRSLRSSNTALVNANSYIWRPWLATWNTGLALSYVDNRGEGNSTGSVVSGDGRLRVFPVSRFPADIFFSIHDTRIDAGEEDSSTGDFRFVRFGATQRYQPESGEGQYSGRVERNIQSDFAASSEETTDQFELTGTHRLLDHELNGSLFVSNTARDLISSTDRLMSLNMHHGYRPADNFSLENTANFSLLQLESDTRATEQRTDLRFTSSGFWRDLDRPLTVRGDLTVTAGESDGGGGSAADPTVADLGVTANYDFTDHIRGTADAGGTTPLSGAGGTTTFQSVALTYTPDDIALGEFRYNWSLNGSTRNRTDSNDAAVQTVSTGANHSISRTITFSDSLPVSLSLDAGQSVSASVETGDSGSFATLSNRASASLAYTMDASAANLRMLALDLRSFGAFSNVVQSLNVSGSYQRRIGRYTSLTADAFLSVTKSSNDGSFVATSDPSADGAEDVQVFSGLNASYRNARLLGFRRLRFESEIRMDSEALIPYSPNAADASLRWRNRFDYSIGRLDIRLTTNISLRSGDNSGADKSVFLHTVRTF